MFLSVLRNMTEPSNVHYIDFDLMKEICHPIAMAIFDSKTDPITDFDEHDHALLESALNNARQTFDGKELYPSFVQKAAILYYGLIKNHAFENGNKRTATATLFVFLYINDLWLVSAEKKVEDYLVELAKRVAKSEGAGEKEKFLREIETWLAQNMVQK